MSGSLPGTGLTALVIGGSSLARRRVVPAFERLGLTVDLASRAASWPAARTGAARTFTDYADALASSAASLVYISTRNHEHVEWATAALATGRHVVVDKPATLSLRDTEALVEEAARRGLLIAEATVYTWHPQFAELRKLASAHGPVTRLMATFTFPPLPAGNFRHRADHGGGALWDLGPYAVTPGRVLFDADPLEIVTRTTTPAASEVETSFSLIMRYRDDRVLVGHYGSTTAYVNRLDAIGPSLAVTVERAFTTPDDAPCRIVGMAGGAAVRIESGPADAFACFLQAILDAIAGGYLAPFAATMCRDARVLDQLRASSRS